jgi:hypothetical protein
MRCFNFLFKFFPPLFSVGVKFTSISVSYSFFFLFQLPIERSIKFPNFFLVVCLENLDLTEMVKEVFFAFGEELLCLFFAF